MAYKDRVKRHIRARGIRNRHSPYVLVGEAPAPDPRRANLDVALACRAVQRQPKAGTMAWLDEHHPLLCEFTLRTRHINVLNQHPGKERNGRGSKFPLKEAKLRAGLVMRHVEQFSPRLLILCGTRVAEAFDLKREGYDFFQKLDCRIQGVQPVVVPHPSGVSHWWNSEDNRRLAKSFLEELGR